MVRRSLLLLALFGSLALSAGEFSRYEGFLPSGEENKVVIWEDCDINEIHGLKAVMSGNWLGGGEYAAQGYIYDRTEDSFTVQMQTQDGNLAKATRYYFRQEGRDITAWGDNSGYVYDGTIGSEIPSGNFILQVSTDKNNGAYGAFGVELMDEETITDLSMVGEELSLSNKVVTLVAPAGGTNLTAKISGEGVVVVKGGESKTIDFVDDMAVSDYITVLSNACIDCVTPTAGTFGGEWVGGPYDAQIHCLKREANRMTFQVQVIHGDGWLKSIKMEMIQEGNEVKMKPLWSRYAPDSTHPYGSDLELDYQDSTLVDNGKYVVKSLTFDLNPGLVLSGSKDWSWKWGRESIIVDGAYVGVSESALPAGHKVTVKNGGTLRLDVAGGEWWGGDSREYLVKKDSTLWLTTWLSIASGAKVIIDGGTIDLWAETYINDLTVRNGGRVIGVSMRVGFAVDPIMRFQGPEELSVELPIKFFNDGQKTATFETDVKTTLKGDVFEESIYLGENFAKSGAAELVLEGESRFIGGFSVNEGTLTLANTAAMKAQNAVELKGGTLNVAAEGVAAGALTLSADASLTLENGSIAFADSSAATWNGGLSVTTKLSRGSKKVRFGENAAALTDKQLKKINIEGYQEAVLDADGYLYGRNNFVIFLQ